MVVIAVMAVSTEAAEADDAYLTGPVTGNELYEACTSLNPVRQTFCYGYVNAIADGCDAARPDKSANNGVFGFVHCARPSVTNKQIADIVVRFLASHPEHRDYGVAGLVAKALAEAFPCR